MSAQRKNRILVVDDSEDNRLIIKRVLELAGMAVECAEDGVEALDCIAENEPDLVVLDWMMPRLSGIDTLRALRERHSANSLPVIMCTARDESDCVSEALSHGANDFVPKPIDAQVLRARVCSQIERRDGMAALKVVNADLERAVADRTLRLLSGDAPAATPISNLPASVAVSVAEFLERAAHSTGTLAAPSDSALREALAMVGKYIRSMTPAKPMSAS